MRIVVDGHPEDVPDGATVADVLELLEEPVRHVIVDVNGSCLRPRDYDAVQLNEGDRLEVIFPASGG